MGDYCDVWVCMPHGARDYEANQTKFSMCPYCEIAKLGAEVERLTYELKRCGDTGYRLNEAYATECDSVDRLRAEFERWKRWDEVRVQLNMTKGEAENDYRQLERDKDAEIERLTEENQYERKWRLIKDGMLESAETEVEELRAEVERLTIERNDLLWRPS